MKCEIRCLNCGGWTEFGGDKMVINLNLKCSCGSQNYDWQSTHSLRSCQIKSHDHGEKE
jgi:hypothetical protein